MTASAKRSMSAAEVVTAVRRHFGAEYDGLGPEWAALDEFSLAPGAGEQRADVFLIRAWSGQPRGHERVTVEVKVSRADLLAELRRPQKSAPFAAVSHRFYLATPSGLLRDEDPVPAEWGILVANRNGCRKVKEAVRRPDPEPVPERALVEAFRRAARAEARIRGACEATAADPALLPRMVKEAEAARAASHRARIAARRESDRLKDFLAGVAAAGGWSCICGKPTAVRRASRGRVEHRDGTPCDQGNYGMAEHDYESLARRLGLRAETDEEDESTGDTSTDDAGTHLTGLSARP